MPAYLIVNIEVKDPVRYAEYVQGVPATIARHGGKYLARGGQAEQLEGEWEPKRVVLLEFPSYADAKEWWSCDAYRPLKELRRSASVGNILLVEGV
jgi:uncharacterized protein (DUF1330 family)